ncbi:nuclear factor Y, subunit B11 [Actinidia rufa]|uniref:Nuclear factor Y, subunit B11 n=1 Tax=Actinidia rufa TaxID=165716 RepID=A0A7J0HB56_9ERIC|nr:nuclear factor Y, subunit B11 [Actinidia rufa]
MAEKAAAVEKAVAETEELPKAIVRRVVKEKLSQLSKEGDISVFREALVAFSESARIFIHYLPIRHGGACASAPGWGTAVQRANDVCKESKRQTINADDVFKALEEIEFPEFVVPLKASLEGQSSHRKVELHEMREKSRAVSITVFSPDNDDSLALFSQCSSILNGMDDLDGLSYSKAMTKLKEDGVVHEFALEFRRKNAGKRSASKAKEANKKKKKESPVENGTEDKQDENGAPDDN